MEPCKSKYVLKVNMFKLLFTSVVCFLLLELDLSAQSLQTLIENVPRPLTKPYITHPETS